VGAAKIGRCVAKLGSGGRPNLGGVVAKLKGGVANLGRLVNKQGRRVAT
jgi:hypothetical protein